MKTAKCFISGLFLFLSWFANNHCMQHAVYFPCHNFNYTMTSLMVSLRSASPTEPRAL